MGRHRETIQEALAIRRDIDKQLIVLPRLSLWFRGGKIFGASSGLIAQLVGAYGK